jgi:hypothetical protein
MTDRPEQQRVAWLRRDAKPSGAAAVPAATVVLIRDGRECRLDDRGSSVVRGNRMGVGDRLAAARADLLRHRFGRRDAGIAQRRRQLADVVDDDVGAALGQQQRIGAA